MNRVGTVSAKPGSTCKFSNAGSSNDRDRHADVKIADCIAMAPVEPRPRPASILRWSAVAARIRAQQSGFQEPDRF